MTAVSGCPRKKEDAEAIRAGKKKPTDIPDEDRDFYLERRYPAFGNLCPRDIASRAAKERCDAGYGVGTGNAVYLDFKYAIDRLGADVVRDRYGNLFDMYQMISDDNPYETPMMIFPASHYTMGGIWVDYELQTSIKGLFPSANVTSPTTAQTASVHRLSCRVLPTVTSCFPTQCRTI